MDDAAAAVKIRPSISPLDGHITAVEWLALDDLRVVAVRTSNGYLLLYSVHAKLIHKQLIHPSRIFKLKAYGIDNGFAQETSSDEVCILMPGVIAKIEGPDIQLLLLLGSQPSATILQFLLEQML